MLSRLNLFSKRSFSSTRPSQGLGDFFDTPQGWYWGKDRKTFGRPWSRQEMRQKSFEDLHKLWWQSLKEVNLLSSQKEEARRFRLDFPHEDRMKTVKTTMANIKFVLWERKNAYQKAQSVFEKHQQMESRKESSIPFVDVDIETAVVKKLDEMAISRVPNVYKRKSFNPRRRKRPEEVLQERLERNRPKGAIVIDVDKAMRS